MRNEHLVPEIDQAIPVDPAPLLALALAAYFLADFGDLLDVPLHQMDAPHEGRVLGLGMDALVHFLDVDDVVIRLHGLGDPHRKAREVRRRGVIELLLQFVDTLLVPVVVLDQVRLHLGQAL